MLTLYTLVTTALLKSSFLKVFEARERKGEGKVLKGPMTGRIKWNEVACIYTLNKMQILTCFSAWRLYRTLLLIHSSGISLYGLDNSLLIIHIIYLEKKIIDLVQLGP